MKLSRVLTLSCVVSVALLLSGCLVTSVHPFYTKDTLTFDSGLIGTWAGDDPTERWEFTRHGDSAYAVTYSEDETDYLMRGHLFKLEGRLYIDLFTESPEDSDDKLMPPPIPSHMVVRIARDDASLQMATLKYGWLDERFESEPGFLAHHRIKEDDGDGSRLVLTAKPPALQRFLKTCPEDAWEDAFELRKLEAGGTAAD